MAISQSFCRVPGGCCSDLSFVIPPASMDTTGSGSLAHVKVLALSATSCAQASYYVGLLI